MKIKIILILLFCSGTVLSQIPGHFYTFSLKDSDGNIIDSANKNYEMTPVKFSDSLEVVLSVKICDDNSTWRFYEGAFGGYGLENTHVLKITKLSSGETMVIEFPSSLSGGKEKYFRDLYAGVIKFQKGTYRIKLPETDNEWDGLKEKKICPLSYMNTTYHDISRFQDQK